MPRKPKTPMGLHQEIFEGERTIHLANVIVGDVADAMLGTMVIAERRPALLDRAMRLYRCLAEARVIAYEIVNVAATDTADKMDRMGVEQGDGEDSA